MPLQLEHTSTCWVFVRQSQCIEVRTCELSVTIDGPRHSRGRYHFDSERDLQSFQIALAEHLSERGWVLRAPKSSWLRSALC